MGNNGQSGPRPDEAFSQVADETRFDTLIALWEADDEGLVLTLDESLAVLDHRRGNEET